MVSYASEFHTYFYNLRRYGLRLSKQEIKMALITIATISFTWSFNKWGTDTFDPIMGITNLVIGAVFAAICLVANQIGQRIVAVYYGYDPQYEYCMLGIGIGVIIAFASRGWVIFFLPGAMNMRHLAASRLGEFRYYTNDWEWAKAGFMGPFGNIMLALIASPIKDHPIVQQFMIMNIMFAAYSLLFLPGNVGLYIFYPQLYWWMFTVGFVAVSSALIFFVSPLLVLPVALFAGGFAAAWQWIKVDKRFPPYEKQYTHKH